jgi:hypothetical protein
LYTHHVTEKTVQLGLRRNARQFAILPVPPPTSPHDLSSTDHAPGIKSVILFFR